MVMTYQVFGHQWITQVIQEQVPNLLLFHHFEGENYDFWCVKMKKSFMS